MEVNWLHCGRTRAIEHAQGQRYSALIAAVHRVTRDYRSLGSELWDRFISDAKSLTDKRDLFIWNHRALVGTLHARLGNARIGNALSAELVQQLETLEGLMREKGDAANTITP